MNLKVLGSSSKGNCYILENEKEALIIECGVSLIEIKKALQFNIQKVVGCIITHEHKDHCKYVSDILKTSIQVFSSAGTIEAMNASGFYKPTSLCVGMVYSIGSFKVMPFDVKHDCAEPFGYLIQHEETGNILFCTDTYFLPYKFKNLSNIIIECNYRLDILDNNIKEKRVHPKLRDRTIQSHMSYSTCVQTLRANDLRQVNNIILIHLSDNNSNEQEFKDGIMKATGKQVYVADKGMSIKFNKTPF